ncbi:hypothetical protein CQS04_01560 [Chryseomicrobium excrementi]|uniref:Type II secretion system protein GspF domain-containing protein n=1 Tax=Chryseomicrobium excrementi TaxID=2041346 RepID=A0A2M9F2A8_9BACL|nr:type II secretion system F family protein [Chryseomicrobium excrementi]PJK17591.1 hypothetical protein CQS04_01560 [Chryseomicrobium excrementi]
MKKKDQAEFLEKIVIAMAEGISATDSIRILAPFYCDGTQLGRINELFEEGHEIDEIFRYLGFSAVIVESIQFAGIHGQLSKVLEHISVQIRKQQQFRGELVKALSYPLGLLLFMSILFITFRIYFLPIFLPVLERANPQAIGKVKVIFSLPFYIIVTLFVLATFIGIVLLVVMKSKSNRWFFYMRGYPVVAQLQNAGAAYRISRELSLLLDSGFTLSQSLSYLQSSRARNVHFACRSILMHLERGESFSQSLRLSGWVPQSLIRYAEHGEIHGYVAKELGLYQEFTIERLQKRSVALVGVAQPLLFLIIGAMVISAYLSLMLPMYNLISL